MRVLCLHTLRADCNAPLTPLRVALPCFASTRSVQIATFPFSPAVRCWFLCLHTLRADCNLRHFLHVAGVQALPPHAPCRLQRGISYPSFYRKLFASTRSVQIATCPACTRRWTPDPLPPHAPCRLQRIVPLVISYTPSLCLHTLRADCNGRNAQNCNIHFFRTCVELVDSFSVLNKSMLR